MAGMTDTVLNDAIHGHMSFNRALVKIINTLEFTRLRYVKQLGFCYYVYPSASHNRFEHSLGTSYLATKLLNELVSLMDENDPAYPTKEERLCVAIAALCHDVGHGPFSHTWEIVMKKAFKKKWLHEDQSLLVVERILKQPEIQAHLASEGVTDEYLPLIFGLIKGEPPADHEIYQTDKYYLFQIVSNSDCDVDVDKWDYLLRDSRLLNIDGFNPERLLRNCRVFEVARNVHRNEICYRDKVIGFIDHMLLIRARLHELAYQHPKVKVIEAMAVDAFVIYVSALPEYFANPEQDVSEFLKLTDALYLNILQSNNEEAKQILERIETRNLYQIIHEIQGIKLSDVDVKEVELKIGEALSNNNENYKNDVQLLHIDINMGSKYTKRGPNCYIYTKKGEVTPWQGTYSSAQAHIMLPKDLRGKYMVIYKKLPKLNPDEVNKCKRIINDIVANHKSIMDEPRIKRQKL